MKNLKIGIFDSGLGGLTVLPFFQELLPKEQVVYFGDTARTPYGSKSNRTIINFALEITQFLEKEGVKAVLIACNTVSAIAIDSLREAFPSIPFFGIVEPAIEAVAREAEKGERIKIIGTRATISSKLYEEKLRLLRPDLELTATACPTFVPLIEEGLREGPLIKAAIDYHLPATELANCDSLLLACTHYPLLTSAIAELYPNLKLYNPAAYLIPGLVDYLQQNALLSNKKEAADIFYASDLSNNFRAMIAELAPAESQVLCPDNFSNVEELDN
ncbi:MAG: glutamate racemase [Eubacteriales bacterium]|nr:glutamate racemase [Eubacteriales bacterium]